MEINFARRVKAQMTRSNFSLKTSPGGIITTTAWPHPFGSSRVAAGNFHCERHYHNPFWERLYVNILKFGAA